MRLAGYLDGVMGTGEHARQLARALQTQGIPLELETLHPEGSPEDHDLAAGFLRGSTQDDDRFGRFNLLCANADSVPRVAGRLGDPFFAGRYTIAFWAWEVSAFPPRFLPAFDHVDEVWVGSRHVRDAVTPLSPVPVVSIPQPVSLPSAVRDDGFSGPLPDGFRILFAFDYLSVFARKNPLGLVEAFARAFAPGSGASLIIKALNPEHDRRAHQRLLAAAAAHPDVHLLTERLSAPERSGLMNAADCYVSLHRAEGFGYTLAESMWLGKPVIATGYSGNVDFMTPDNSYLVDHRLVPIGAGSEPYPPDGLWAEPDLDHAARLMRQVFENREEARRRGERAAADIRRTHGPEVAGTAMRSRLEAVLRFAILGDRIRGGPVATGGPSSSGTARRAARRALLRALRPATVHQSLVDEELVRALRGLEGRVAQLEAEVRRLRDGGR